MDEIFNEMAIKMFLISLVIVLIAKGIIIAIKKIKKKKYSLKYEFVSAVLIVYVIVILVYVLIPTDLLSYGNINLIPFRDSFNTIKRVGIWSVQSRQLLYNVLLFVPFGFLGALALKFKGRKSKWIIPIGLLFTITIETSQYFLRTGRACDIDDVILNTLGTIIGYYIALALVEIYRLIIEIRNFNK